MRFSQSLLSLLLLIGSSPGFAFEAHEWGTFTSLVGSNGVTQNGMFHEDEVLPDFVHSFGELRIEAALPPQPPRNEPSPTPRPPESPCRNKACFDQEFMSQNVVTQKMETPVIYFYSDREQNVDINVKFPEGVVTDTYPGPVRTSPRANDISTIAGGDTTFSVKVLTSKVSHSLPAVPSGNIYGHARQVASNIVVSGAETEKFVFYRGIGRFQPRLSIQSKGGALNLTAPTGFIPQALFLVHVDSRGDGQMLKVGSLTAGATKQISANVIAQLQNHGESQNPDIVTGQQALGMLTDSLIHSGLNRDEALAMVNTWKNGYLQVQGLRLLYILPSNEVEQLLPLAMTPAPTKLVRSFVGRIEILLDTEEQAILNQVLNQGDKYRTEGLGRFAEPILRRVAQVFKSRPYADPETKAMLERLVQRASVADTKTTVIQ